MSELITLHPEYAEWIRNVGKNFKQCQIKAASQVNEEMLRFYWNLGRDIDLIINRAEYGSKFFEKLSSDLQKELPDESLLLSVILEKYSLIHKAI